MKNTIERLHVDVDATYINIQSADTSDYCQYNSGYTPLLTIVNRIPIYVEMRTVKGKEEKEVMSK